MRSLLFCGAPQWADRLAQGALMVTVLLGCPAWTPTPPMSVERGDHTATLLLDGRLLVVGGRDSGPWQPNDIWNIAEVYDPAAGAWTTTAPMLTARFRHAAAPLPDGRVLVAGGLGASIEPLASTEIYDSALDAWSPAAPMGSAAGVWTTVTPLLDGRVLAVYGDYAEIYDAPTNTWSPAMAPLQARWAFAATRLLDGRVLLTGGHPDPELTQAPALASAEIYDPEAGTFAPAGPMIDGREYHTAVLLQDGRVLIAGGHSGLSLLATTELYDPSTNTFQSAPPMFTPRLGMAAAALPNGDVLVTGGDVPFLVGYVTIDSVERYDSAAGVWQPAGAMLSTRSRHTLTPLLDGKVLAAGGFFGTAISDGFGFLDSAETIGGATDPIPYGDGAPCNAANECQSGICSNQSCCATDCPDNACFTCAGTGQCAPLECIWSGDTSCLAESHCDPQVGCVFTPLPDGEPCRYDAELGTCVSGVCQPVAATTGAGGGTASASSSATGATSGSGGSSSATGATSGSGGHAPPASFGGLGCTIRPATPSTLSPFGLAASVLLLVARRRRRA
jgi:hypothetical protein